MLICSEKFYHFQSKKHYKNNLMLTYSRKFWLTLTLTSDSSLMLIESSLMLWQMSNLILILVNKLATVMLEMNEQYNYHIKETDSETKNLIWMLSLQAIIWSKIRLTTNNFVSFRKVFESFNQKIMFFNVFIRKTAFFENFIKKFTLFNNFNVREKKSSILNLIKNA